MKSVEANHPKNVKGKARRGDVVVVVHSCVSFVLLAGGFLSWAFFFSFRRLPVKEAEGQAPALATKGMYIDDFWERRRIRHFHFLGANTFSCAETDRWVVWGCVCARVSNCLPLFLSLQSLTT
jgi:hypothetical protein